MTIYRNTRQRLRSVSKFGLTPAIDDTGAVTKRKTWNSAQKNSFMPAKQCVVRDARHWKIKCLDQIGVGDSIFYTL